MKLFISRGKFDLLCQGLSPVERDRLAGQVVIYPDGDPPAELFEVDDERVGRAWERLMRDQVVPAPPPLPFLEPKPSPWPIVVDETHVFRGEEWFQYFPPAQDTVPVCPSKPVELPDPWEEAGPGLWVAPAGTPPPWVAAEQVINDLAADDSSPLDDLRRGMMVAAAHEPPPPRRLEAGYYALYALTTLAAPRKDEGWMMPGVLADMTGVPIVLNTDLVPNTWRLVDPVTGEVLLEGTIGGATIEQLRAVIDEAVEQLAEETGVPLDLLRPDYLE